MKLLYAQSNIDEIVNRENFASFSYECFDNSRIIPEVGMTAAQYMKRVKEQCMEFARRFGTDGGIFCLPAIPAREIPFLATVLQKK